MQRAFNAALKRPLNRYLRGSYSQYGEDLMIDRLLGRKQSGFYVDIGANDPVNSNNSMRFYRRGWRGVNVEPDPSCFERLQSMRPGDVNLQIGIAAESGRRTFYALFPSTRSTFSKELADQLVEQGFGLVAEQEVEIRPLSEVLDDHCAGRDIDFISIDTEGYDEQVLRSNDWERYAHRLLCIESADEGGSHRFLLDRGYQRVLHNAANSIYCRPAQDISA